VARLDEIPGVGATAAAVIIAEVGADMSKSRTCVACPKTADPSAPSPTCCPPASAPFPATAGMAVRYDRSHQARPDHTRQPGDHPHLTDLSQPRSTVMVTIRATPAGTVERFKL
jgi:hypothetical protein